MLAVVERIIKRYDDDVPLEATKLAVWDVAKQEIVVDRTVCKSVKRCRENCFVIFN